MLWSLGGPQFALHISLPVLEGRCLSIFVLDSPVHFPTHQDRKSGDVEPKHQNDERTQGSVRRAVAVEEFQIQSEPQRRQQP